MKAILFSLMFTFSIHGFSSRLSDNHLIDSVQIIEQFSRIYRVGDFYLGKQPDMEIINWLKSEGVKLVINLRTENEIIDFTKSSFNEDSLINNLGINYISIPVSSPDSYNLETLKELIKVISNHSGKIFIHCASGGRVKCFFMAYLIEEKGYSINEAMNLAYQLGYYFPLSLIMEKEIDMQFKK